jgi:hypothetical protein
VKIANEYLVQQQGRLHSLETPPYQSQKDEEKEQTWTDRDGQLINLSSLLENIKYENNLMHLLVSSGSICPLVLNSLSTEYNIVLNNLLIFLTDSLSKSNIFSVPMPLWSVLQLKKGEKEQKAANGAAFLSGQPQSVDTTLGLQLGGAVDFQRSDLNAINQYMNNMKSTYEAAAVGMMATGPVMMQQQQQQQQQQKHEGKATGSSGSDPAQPIWCVCGRVCMLTCVYLFTF